MTEPGRVAIVGCGLIGGSLLRALQAQGRELLAIDLDEATLAAIRGELKIATSSSLADAATASIIVLATPIPALLGAFPTLATALGDRPVVVTDVAGIKQPVMEAARVLPPSARFVGGHPMAGKEHGGFGESDASLFRNRTVALCATETVAEATAQVDAMWRSVGARTLRCEAQAHDAAVARVSHLPHLVAASLARVAGRGDALSDSLAASGLRDTTRVAEDPTIRFAVARNKDVVALAREVAEELRSFADKLERGESIEQALDEGAATRRRIYPR